jgi:hypothetical protein
MPPGRHTRHAQVGKARDGLSGDNGHRSRTDHGPQVLSGNAMLSESCNKPIGDDNSEADRTRTGARRSA